MVKRDKIATELCGFTDKRSYCRPDGKQVCYGVDWAKRKVELYLRCKAQCEMNTVLKLKHVPGCSGIAEEPHHIVARSKGRDDRISNLAGLSHACHASLDKRKVRWSKP